MLGACSHLYDRAMSILTVWLGLIGAGGLCYPRRPRASGVLPVAIGIRV